MISFGVDILGGVVRLSVKAVCSVGEVQCYV